MITVGSFTIEKQISEGSFGITFRGFHNLLKTPVCLKQEKTGRPEIQELFRGEATLLWSLTHESIPAIRDYIETTIAGEFFQFIVMSYVAGKSLTDIVKEHGFVDDEHICWIVDRLLAVLNYLHFNGVVHGDIKPDNIMLDIPNHHATLLDYGLANASPGKHSLALGGTPFYMPPEFADGFPPLPQSDLYSVAMVVVFLSGGDVGTATFPVDMKPALRQFFENMLRRDPFARPERAGVLQAELAELRLNLFGQTSTKEAFKTRR